MVKGQMSSAGDGSVELHDAEIEAALPAVTRGRRNSHQQPFSLA